MKAQVRFAWVVSLVAFTGVVLGYPLREQFPIFWVATESFAIGCGAGILYLFFGPLFRYIGPANERQDPAKLIEPLRVLKIFLRNSSSREDLDDAAADIIRDINELRTAGRSEISVWRYVQWLMIREIARFSFDVVKAVISLIRPPSGPAK